MSAFGAYRGFENHKKHSKNIPLKGKEAGGGSAWKFFYHTLSSSFSFILSIFNMQDNK